jgi:CHRD domain
MRLRTLAVLFAVGLVAVGVAVAGINSNWSVHPAGAFEVPVRDTNAQGQAIFNLAEDGQSIDYRLIASNIDNVVQAHIHIGPPGVNGPITVFLFGPVAAGGGPHDGVLATGTITAANLIGPLVGQPLSALVEAMRSNNAYVNVHTNDGVDPINTGPGDFPGGEIRADISP